MLGPVELLTFLLDGKRFKIESLRSACTLSFRLQSSTRQLTAEQYISREQARSEEGGGMKDQLEKEGSNG